MPGAGQSAVCVNQPVKPEDLRNVDHSLHREVRRHHLFLINVFARGLVVFKGGKKKKNNTPNKFAVHYSGNPQEKLLHAEVIEQDPELE